MQKLAFFLVISVMLAVCFSAPVNTIEQSAAPVLTTYDLFSQLPRGHQEAIVQKVAKELLTQKDQEAHVQFWGAAAKFLAPVILDRILDG